MTDTQPVQSPRSYRTLWLRLSPKVTIFNFITYLIGALFTVSFFVFLNSTSSFVLGQLLRIPSDQLGSYTGSLSFYDQLVSIVMVFVWGVASDFVGRRTIYSLGYIFIALSLFLTTFATEVYPSLLLYRLIFAIGGSSASSMLTAVLADYAGDEDRGKISAVAGMMTGLGAVISAFVFIRLPSTDADAIAGLRKAYIIVGAIAAVTGILLFFGLRREYGAAMGGSESSSIVSTDDERTVLTSASASTGEVPISAEKRVANSAAAGGESSAEDASSSSRPAAARVESVTGRRLTVKQRIINIGVVAKEGILAARDPIILLGYLGGFLARADTIAVTTFISLWVYNHFGCSDGDKTCREAYVLSSTLSGVAETLTLVGAPIFGYLGDKVYRPISTLIATILGFIGYAMVFAIENPTSKAMYVAMSLIGLGEIGMIVSSLALVTGRFIPPEIRGSVAGVYSFFGALGILIVGRVGGELFDTWKPTAPFFLVLAGRIIVFPIVVVILVRDVWLVLKERKEAQAAHAAQGGEGQEVVGASVVKTSVGQALRERYMQKKAIGSR